MFKNLCIYRLPKPLAFTADIAAICISGLEEQLTARRLQGCSASDARSIGWVPPRDGDSFVHVVNHQLLLAIGVEEKLLPSAVVNQFAAEKTMAIESAEGRRVGRKEMRELREQMTQELLPRAFARRRTTFGWIDPVNGWLVIDAATPAKADEFIEQLRKSVDGLPVKRLKLKQLPVSAMTAWVASGEAPAGFSIDQDLELRSAEKATVRYAHHHLEGEDIRQHIAEGKGATRLALTWRDRISFVVTDELQIKRLQFLDILKEQTDGQANNEAERFDLDFTLMTGETARMLDDIVAAFGGELAEVA